MRGELKYTNYLDRIRKLVTFQFEDSPVFDKFLQLMAEGATEIQQVYKDLLELRSIETAEGAQLDIIGKIVGQDRLLYDVEFFEFFGFQSHFQAGSFGTEVDARLGAKFKGVGDRASGNILLDDDMYRVFIKAKIARNVTRATPEEVMHFINFIFNTDKSSVIDEGGGKLSIFLQ